MRNCYPNNIEIRLIQKTRPIMSKISKIRKVLYTTAKILGDVDAVSSGKVGRRVKNRVKGKILGKLFGKL